MWKYLEWELNFEKKKFNLKKPATYAKHPYIWTLFASSLKTISEELLKFIMQVSPKLPNFKGVWPKWPWRRMSRSPSRINRFWKLSRIHILCTFGENPSTVKYLISVPAAIAKRRGRFLRFSLHFTYFQPWNIREGALIRDNTIILFDLSCGQAQIGCSPRSDSLSLIGGHYDVANWDFFTHNRTHPRSWQGECVYQIWKYLEIIADVTWEC